MAVSRVTPGVSLLLALSLIGLSFAAPAPVVAAEPKGFEYFHTYTETLAVIDSAVARRPNLAQRLSIGRSHEGRHIWGIRITSGAGSGQKPEILIQGLMHGRERASGELAVYMIKVLVNNYGQNTKLGRRVTRILDSTVVWILPMTNPDGAEFDINSGTFRKWRKNRQPIPGSNAIGVDLNRQFGFMWGCCGGSSANPSSDTYRGPEPWWAPEVRHYRDFVKSRRIDGKQRLVGILSVHSAGRLVLWPYAYTKQDVPSTMTMDDNRAMVALARGMAERNGYRAKQGSDMYIVDGDADDWAYGKQRIFAFTIEMAKGSQKRYYPTKKELSADLNRNRKAILWFLEQSECMYGAAGLGAKYC